MRYVEDPSIQRVAELETARLLERIANQMSLGCPFFVARERVLAEELLDIQTAYGRTTATRVARAVQSIPPSAKPFRDLEKDQARKLSEKDVLMRKGRIGWWDALNIRLTGLPWS